MLTKIDILTKFNELLKIVSKDNLSRYIKNHFPDYFEYILENTSFLDKFEVKDDKNKRISIFERIFCIEHNLWDRPKCQHCKTEYVNGFVKTENRYRKWCSPKCQASDNECLSKSQKTKMSLYGDPNYNATEKAKQTRFSKNNGNYHTSDFVDKLKKTKMERYGDENFTNPDKGKLTKLEKYGSPVYNNFEKNKQTKQLRYGDPNYNNREKFKETVGLHTPEQITEINDKRKSSCLDKYGVESVTQLPEIQKKIRNTNLEKYGVVSSLQLKENHDKSKHTIREKSWEFINLNNEYTPCFTRDEYINCTDPDHIWKWKHIKCGHEFEGVYDNGKHKLCPHCYKSGTSNMEQEIVEYIRSIISDRVYNRELLNRRIIDNRELDIYIPTKNLAIEFDGLYFHSEVSGNKSHDYHLIKTNECKEKGIRLIHIFEDEWCYKKRIVKSKLRNLLLPPKYRIFARKCVIKEIDNNTKDKFVEKYHIQGKDISGIRLGLFYYNHLVAVMTFCKSRLNSNYEYELSRFCSLSNFQIVGGASKLLSYFERHYNPKSLITFADKRWSVGNLYYKLGFTLKNESRPNYFYTKDQQRFSRLPYQKYKLKSKLSNFDSNLSESQNMFNNGFDRIFDCGNMVFIKEYI